MRSNRLLTPLARHSLVGRDPEARTYSVHRLVQAVLLDELTAATRKDLAERAVKALDRTFPDVAYANWPRCERLVSHALAARGWIESEDLLVPAAVQLLNQAGYYLYVRARYAEPEPLYRRALAIWEVAPGRDHPDTAQGLNNLAVLLRVQGHLHGEAEELARRALAIREKALGPDHPDTAISLINLALLFQAQGRYGEAEPLCRRALTIREKAMGPDHPDTAQSLNDLALLLQVQGRLAEPEPLYLPRPGDLGEGEDGGPGPPRHGPKPRQPGVPPPGAGPAGRGGAAIPPRPGHPREDGGPGPPRHADDAPPHRPLDRRGGGRRARRCGYAANCSRTGSASRGPTTPKR